MTARILVVDDESDLESLMCLKFRKNIRAKEFEFVFAHNGLEALNKLHDNHHIDMVLTDINMPELDGLTLLAKVNDIDPTIKTVILSAYGDMPKIRTAMNCGAFDFLNKPIDFQDLETTIKRTLQHVQQIKANLRFRQDKELELRQSEIHAREQAQQLEKALYNLQQTQAQLVQTEKMSSLGQLVAGIAHEINNPVNFIYGNLTHTNNYTQDLLNLLNLYQQHYPNPVPEIRAQAEAIDLEFLMADLPKILSSMQVGAERIRQIVLSLRNFSRLDEAQKKPVDIHSGLDSTLLILQLRLKANPERPAIQVLKEYGNLPLVECYAGQLNQVFMNLLANAIDALEERVVNADSLLPTPSIRIRTQVLNANQVSIQIADNGSGMTQEVQQRLFDPFFTTKPVGKGTGLGLSISYQIVVEKHGGQLKCLSAPGQGAEFIIEIPIQQHMEAPSNAIPTGRL